MYIYAHSILTLPLLLYNVLLLLDIYIEAAIKNRANFVDTNDSIRAGITQ